MLTSFLFYKGKVNEFYKRFETYILIGLKFILALMVYAKISDGLGYYAILNNSIVRLFLSVLSAVAPAPIFVLLVIAVIMLHLFKLSVILAGVALCFILIFYFLYLKFAPEQGLMMFAIPVFAPFGLHYTVPLYAGVFSNPSAAIPVAISFVMTKLLAYTKEAAAMLGEDSFDIENSLKAIQHIVDQLLADNEIKLYAGVFVLVVLVTYGLSRIPVDFGWYIGIGAGTLAAIFGMAIGSSMLDVSINVVSVFIGSLFSGIIISIIQFFRCTVDYTRKESLQFEDDEYFYYVKAIPKINVPTPELQVKKIQSKNTGEAGRRTKVEKEVKRDKENDTVIPAPKKKPQAQRPAAPAQRKSAEPAKRQPARKQETNTAQTQNRPAAKSAEPRREQSNNKAPRPSDTVKKQTGFGFFDEDSGYDEMDFDD